MLGIKLNILSAKIYFLRLKINVLKKMPFFKKKKEANLFKKHFMLTSLISTYQEQCFRRIFGPHAKGVMFATHNGTLVSSPMDTEINRSLGNYAQYDLDKIHFLSNFIKKEHTLYFLGVHIGTLLIPLSRNASKTIGFEANPDTFEYLKSNLNLNKVLHTTVYNYGVYDKQGTSSFYKSKANTGGSKIKPLKDQFLYNYDRPAETVIQTICLDSFVEANRLPYPDVMVVDIEGAEYAALKMGGQCLTYCKYLYIEFVPHHLFNVADIDVNTFLSVITPFFGKMIIVNSPHHEFSGEDIYKVLTDFFIRGICVDLLFFK
ncbi:FkbM family methyltransferase [Pedobacter sp. 22226]|uniref:FkbM family methyltransferase n=1 Tax=Pedobacter sp. 22226 TaxID=3453894 RepID=UPI003F870BC9